MPDFKKIFNDLSILHYSTFNYPIDDKATEIFVLADELMVSTEKIFHIKQILPDSKKADDGFISRRSALKRQTTLLEKYKRQAKIIIDDKFFYHARKNTLTDLQKSFRIGEKTLRFMIAMEEVHNIFLELYRKCIIEWNMIDPSLRLAEHLANTPDQDLGVTRFLYYYPSNNKIIGKAHIDKSDRTFHVKTTGYNDLITRCHPDGYTTIPNQILVFNGLKAEIINPEHRAVEHGVLGSGEVRRLALIFFGHLNIKGLTMQQITQLGDAYNLKPLSQLTR